MPFDSILSNEFQEVTLNGTDIKGDERWEVISEYVDSAFHSSACPFPKCGARMHYARKKEIIQAGKEWIEEIKVAECPKCGHWQVMWYEDLGQGLNGCPTAEWEAQLGKLAEFELCLPEGCQEDLAKHLRASPDSWNCLPPRKLETLIADIFKANYTSCEVMHVGQPNDGGIDVVFVDNEEKRWLISVKRRIDETKGEGVGTIRNLLGAMVLDGSRYGVVVSTVDHFTYQAYRAVDKATEIGLTLSLIDRGKLDRMVGVLLPTMEWTDLVIRRKPEWLAGLKAKVPDRRQLTFRDYIQRSQPHA